MKTDDRHAFEGGVPVPIAAAPDNPEDSNPSQIRQEALARLLDWLVKDGASAEVIGRRILMLGYLCRLPSAPSSQRHLASRMRLSVARVNAIFCEMRRELAKFDRHE